MMKKKKYTLFPGLIKIMFGIRADEDLTKNPRGEWTNLSSHRVPPFDPMLRITAMPRLRGREESHCSGLDLFLCFNIAFCEGKRQDFCSVLSEGRT